METVQTYKMTLANAISSGDTRAFTILQGCPFFPCKEQFNKIDELKNILPTNKDYTSQEFIDMAYKVKPGSPAIYVSKFPHLITGIK